MSFDGIADFMVKPSPRASCEYCGRRAQPPHAVNCCGCGAPLNGLTYDAVEVTTVGSAYPTYVLKAKPCLK